MSDSSASPTAQQVGCGGTGSTKWTVVLDSLTATAANFTVTQGGIIVFCRNYVASDPSPNTGTPC